MRSTTLILSSIETSFVTNLSPPIQLDPNKEFEAALLSINLYNSIPNITEKNNKFIDRRAASNSLLGSS